VLSFLDLKTGTILDGWEPTFDMVCVKELLGFLAENLGTILSSPALALLELIVSEGTDTQLPSAWGSLPPIKLISSFLGLFCVPPRAFGAGFTYEQGTV
jgi:hypothetical protein